MTFREIHTAEIYLGRGAEEVEHVHRAALQRQEEPVSSISEARRRELAAVRPSSLIEHLDGPLDAVHVGRELVLRRGARRDVPQDGEHGREVGGVLERGDERTSSGHCDVGRTVHENLFRGSRR